MNVNQNGSPEVLREIIAGYEDMQNKGVELSQFQKRFFDQAKASLQTLQGRNLDRVLTVNLSDHDWIQMLGYISHVREAYENNLGEEAAQAHPGFQIATNLRQRILDQLKPQRMTPAPAPHKPIEVVAEELRKIRSIEKVHVANATKDYPHESLDITLNDPLHGDAVKLFRREGLELEDALLTTEGGKVMITVWRRVDAKGRSK